MPPRRWVGLGAFLVSIAAGLVLRRYGYDLHLTFAIVKFGGSIIWGAMVYWLFAMLLVRRRAIEVAWIAIVVSILVELFRLFHTPWLDAFRLTTSGALLLGRVFSVWNIVSYIAGILIALACDRLWLAGKA
jgi:hypothetical protein